MSTMQVTESLALKVVSLLLALILWITILGFKREEIRKNIKLEPLLPPGKVITNKIPTHIQFVLSGPRILLKEVEKKMLPIHPDLRHTRDTTIAFAISEDLAGELPAGVKVMGFHPANIVIHLEEVVERSVPVKPTLKGAPAPGYEIASIHATPSKVSVSGPKSLLQSLESLGTEPFDVTDLKGTKEGVVPVEADANADNTQGYQLSRDKIVRVRVTVRRAQKSSSREDSQ